jgi:hypothetical protein
MCPTMVSLLTLLPLAGIHARAQIPGPVDPTDLKVRVLNIDGVRYELLLPAHVKMLAVSVTASSFVIKRPCEAEGLQSFLCAQTGSNLAGRCVLNSPPPRSHVTPPLCRRPFELHPALPRPRAVPIHTRATG